MKTKAVRSWQDPYWYKTDSNKRGSLRQPLFKRDITDSDNKQYVITGYLEEQDPYGVTRSVILKPADGSPGGFYQNLNYFNELKTAGWQED